jgi:hypothetical protein
MKTAKVILLAVVGLLLLADISLRIRDHSSFSNSTASITNSIFGGPLSVMLVHSNSVDAAWDTIVMQKDKSWQPLWAEWDFGHGGRSISYFFQGKIVLNIHTATDQKPGYEFVSRNGEGETQVHWWDRKDSGIFTEKISYNTNGDLSKYEVWYDEAWHIVDRRNGTNGIVINGQWLHLKFDTNGIPMMDTKTNQ